MIDIELNGVPYPVPSSAADTNWASKQVAFEQAVADAINDGIGGADGVVVRFTDGATPAQNRAAVELAISRAVANGTRKIIFTECDATFDLSVIVSGNSNDKLIDVPTNFQIVGSGWNSVLRVTGLDGTAAGDIGRNLFGIGLNCVDVHISGLHFIGENGVDATGFTYVENNQSACVNFRQDNSQSRCSVTGCYFFNLWGFSVHSGGYIYDSTVSGNWTFWCANGINVNGSRTVQSYNVIYSAEGFELTGSDNIIEGNEITDALGNAISIGGNQTVGYVDHGNQVVGNNINGATDPDGGQASGIALGNATCYALVSGNTVRACTGGAILAGVTDLVGAVSYGHVITGNVCINNSNNATDVYNVIISGGGKCVVTGNTFRNDTVSTDGREAGLGANYGLVVNSDDNYIAGNTIGGKIANYAIVFQPSTLRNVLGPNNYVTSTTEGYWGAGATQNGSPQLAASAGTLLNYNRIGGLSFHTWGVYGDGKQEWGSGSGAPDTNLYRSAANTLKTDDDIIAVGSITGSNVSGTNTGDITLGTVGSSPNASGASLAGQALNLQPADGSNPGVVSTAAQTLAGIKTFSSQVRAASLGVGNSASASGPVGNVVKKIQVYDDSGNSLGYLPVYDAIT